MYQGFTVNQKKLLIWNKQKTQTMQQYFELVGINL